MAGHPERRLRQRVIVLAEGYVPGVLRDGDDLLLRVEVVYRRDCDPEPMLADPALAPLAVLARAADTGERAELLRRALAVITDRADPRRLEDLVQVTLVLAAIHLHPDTIDAAGKGTQMPITLEGTFAGQIIEGRAERRGFERGLEQGIERGLEQGIERGLEQGIERGLEQGMERGVDAGVERVLAAVLTRRFGPDQRVGQLAHALRDLPLAVALERAETASSMEELTQ